MTGSDDVPPRTGSTGDPGAAQADFRDHAGDVRWPVSTADLISTDRCPACFVGLISSTCRNCGLDLTHPAAARLLDLSRFAASTLDDRLAVIGLIRYDTDASRRRPAPVAPTAQERVPAAPLPPVTEAPIIPSPAADAPAPRSPRRIPSVQLVLLLTGVSALSVGAVFFLVYAFINFGIIWRSVIIAAITVGAFAASMTLAKRRLRATAEGIAVFAMVLVYLDSYAVRANDFFDAGSVDGAVWWGATILLSSIGFVLWHRGSGLRSPALVGFPLLAPGAGILVGGALADTPSVVDTLGDAGIAYAAAMTVGVVSLAHRLLDRDTARLGRRRPERITMLVSGWLALAGALPAAWLLEGDLASVIASVGVAVVAGVHLVVAVTVGTPSTARRVAVSAFGSLAAFALAAIGAVVAIRSGDAPVVFLVPSVVAVGVALGFEAATRRADRSAQVGGVLRTGLAAGAVTAAVVGALVALVPVAAVVAQVLSVVADALDAPWTRDPGDGLAPASEPLGYSLLALAALVVLSAAAWGAQRMLRLRGRRLAALVFFGVGTLVAAIPLLGAVGPLVGGWFGLAALLVTTLLVARDRLPARPVLLGGVVVATTLGWMTSAASTSTWAVGYLAALALVLALRFVVGRRIAAGTRTSGTPLDAVRAVTTAIATLLVLAAAATSALLLVETGDGLPRWTPDATRFTELAAILLLAVAALLRRDRAHDQGSEPAPWRPTSLDRSVVFGISIVASLAAAFWSQLERTGGSSDSARFITDPVGPPVLSALLLLALLAWASRRSRGNRLERLAAAVSFAPVVYLTVDGFERLLDLPSVATTITPMSAALLTTAGGLAAMAITRRRAAPADLTAVALEAPISACSFTRLAREVGVAVVAIPALIGAALRPDDSTWLVLLLAAVTALLAAVSPDGVFASRSPRRRLGWLALGLGIAALWWKLLDERATDVEAFVLPVAGMLLLVALLVWRATRTTAGQTAPILALAGLLTGILPLAVTGAEGALLRPLLVGAISATLLLVGTLPLGTPALRPYLRVAALAGALGVLVTTGARAVTLATDIPTGARVPFALEAWLGALVALFVIAGFGLARDRDDGRRRERTIASQVLPLVAITVLTALEASALLASPSLLRAMIALLLLAAVHVLAFALAEPPLTVPIAWTALAYAAAIALIAVGAGSVEVVEVAGVPLALALLASGSIRLAEVDRARSWPWLGPGTAVLLIPSLLATIDDRPLWRLVGLGVVGVAVIVLAVTRRLQAPFVLASAVVVVHAVSTFAPQIRAAYEFLPWWLWLVFGGVILILLAARYEHRVKNLRDVALRVGSLR